MNYNKEIKNILFKVYEHKLLELAAINNINNINPSNIDYYKEVFKNSSIYLGNELENILKDIFPKDKEGYFLRCEISKLRNCYYPKLYNENGQVIKNNTDNKYSILLWESHMDNFLMQDLYKNFTKKDFIKFIDENLISLYEKINEFVNQKYSEDKLTIVITDTESLSEKVKSMILNKELDFSYIYDLIDLNNLRNEMAKTFTPLAIYSELDKIEDEPEYCLNNFFKYNNEELYKFLVNNKGFKIIGSFPIAN